MTTTTFPNGARVQLTFTQGTAYTDQYAHLQGPGTVTGRWAAGTADNDADEDLYDVEMDAGRKLVVWASELRWLPSCSVAGHGEMKLRTDPTPEQAALGTWFECTRPRCFNSVLHPNAELRERLGEQVPVTHRPMTVRCAFPGCETPTVPPRADGENGPHARDLDEVLCVRIFIDGPERWSVWDRDLGWFISEPALHEDADDLRGWLTAAGDV